MLTTSQKLKMRLDSFDSDEIRILFLQRENLSGEQLKHLKRGWNNLTTISLGGNQLRVLNCLSQCVFNNLTELSLKSNNIESIQCLTLVTFPKLQRLILKGNHIHSLRSARRLYVPELTFLSLYKNDIIQWEGISQSETPKLDKLQLQYVNNKTIGEDNRWIFKLQTQKLKILNCSSLKRISLQCVKKQLRRKFQLEATPA